MNKERVSNFELLRIISMFFIVLYHVILHGNVVANCTNESLKIIFNLILLFIIVHVNSYVLLSGYFQSKSNFKQAKLWSIISANWFYKIAIVILFSLLGIRTFTSREFFINFFPLNLEGYWFIGNYLIVYCLSPFLNKLIESLNKHNYQKLLFVLILIFSIFPYISGNRLFHNNGFTLYNFIILYLIGGYLRRHPLEKSYIFKNFSKNLYQLTTLILFIVCVIINYSFNKTAESLLGTNSLFDMFGQGIIDTTRAYSNPLIMLQTIAYFAFFSTLNIKSKFINKLSSLTLGIYFSHDNDYVRGVLYKWLKIDMPGITSYKFVLYVIAISILIYIAGSIIEWIRQLLFKGISKLKPIKIIREKYYNYIQNIYLGEQA